MGALAEAPELLAAAGFDNYALLNAWEDFHHEVDEYRELDGERVLMLVHGGGRGKDERT